MLVLGEVYRIYTYDIICLMINDDMNGIAQTYHASQRPVYFWVTNLFTFFL